MHKRILYIDVIRAVAIIMVVLLHVSAFPLRFMTVDTTQLKFADFFQSLTRASVPLFVMISGALLLSPTKEQYKLSYFLRKRFSKIIIPFIGWVIFAFLWKSMFYGNTYRKSFSFIQALSHIATGKEIYYHFWFIYMIIGLYLVAPILQTYIKHADKNELFYFVTLWVISSSLIPFISHEFSFNISTNSLLTTSYIGYFVLGHFLQKFILSRKQVIFSSLLLLFLVILTYYLTVPNGKYDGYYHGYFRPNTVIISTLIFLILRSPSIELFVTKRRNLVQFFNIVSTTSLGIYFIHPFIIDTLRLKLNITGATFHASVGIPVLTIIVLCCSTFIIFIIQKIPYLRALVP